MLGNSDLKLLQEKKMPNTVNKYLRGRKVHIQQVSKEENLVELQNILRA